MTSFVAKAPLILKYSSPVLMVTPIGYWLYNKRRTALQHPVMHRALLHLQMDNRIVDFCGENIKPGYWISVNEDPTDNYIKFDFKLKGSSGDLGASIIADYLTHRELTILEEERQDFFKQKKELNDEIKKSKKSSKEALEGKKKELVSAYIPIDFDAYTI